MYGLSWFGRANVPMNDGHGRALPQPSSRVGLAQPSAFGRPETLGDGDARRPLFAFVNDKTMTGAMRRWETPRERVAYVGLAPGPGPALVLCCTDGAMRTSR